MDAFNSKLLDGKTKLHFVGIGGSGMFPLVQILHEVGYEITGSDVNEGDIIERERKMGIEVKMGHNAANVHGAQLVVYTAAVMQDNPEVADKIEAEIRANAYKLMPSQAKVAARAAGRAVDVSADDFEDGEKDGGEDEDN